MQENKDNKSKISKVSDGTPVDPESNEAREAKIAGEKTEKTEAKSKKENQKSSAAKEKASENSKETANASEKNSDNIIKTGAGYGYEFEEPFGGAASYVNYEKASGDEKSKRQAESGSPKNTGGSGAATKAKKKSNENVKAIAWTLIVLAAIIILIIVLSNSGPKTGIIKGLKTARYGEENQVTLNLNDYKYKKGDTITWKVDDKEVQKKSANDKSAFIYDASTAKVGTHVVKAFLDGKEIAKFDLKVSKPLLKVETEKIEVVYGNPIPETNCKISGFVDGDTAESLNLTGLASTDVKRFDKVGQYQINLKEIKTDKYDVEIVNSGVTVLPREVAMKSKAFSKVYDGTETMEIKNLVLDGAVKDDKILLNASVTFADKNVGSDKKATLKNVNLTGINAENYVLKTPDIKGEITPKEVVLKRVIANDKIYDGTTNVTFSQVGNLDGAIKTDSVAVGEITAAFTNGKPAKDVKVEIYNVSLVGEDSKNYQVKIDCDVSANIMRTGSNGLLPSTNGNGTRNNTEERKNPAA